MASFWLLKGFSSYVSQVQSNMLHHVSWAKFICKCHTTVSAHVRIVHNVQFKLPSTVQWTKWQCLPVGVTFVLLLFQFLCFVTWFWVLYLFQSRYVHFTWVRKFHDSLTLNDFFFNHITNFRDGCPVWLFKVLLPSLVFVICTSPVSWDSLILPATAAVKTCFSCKKIKTSDPP